MTKNTLNSPTTLNNGSETFDPGDTSGNLIHDTEFPILDRHIHPVSKRPKTRKRTGDPLDQQIPLIPPQKSASASVQESQPRKWTFKDMSINTGTMWRWILRIARRKRRRKRM
ncbi:translation elongation factor EF1B [Striga asiatica]|uniref:Translation elongation factor EF1B n=1 Tax=Striga asiatica TaxID=4170 RepID=A0A5A7P6W2_STRAF|nr:translation elongation factor EF1B [Striga asiatica]